MMLPDFSKNFANDTSAKKSDDAQAAPQQRATVPEQPPKEFDIRYLLAVLLLVGSIVAGGGLFGFNAYLDREIATVEDGIVALEEVTKTNDILDLALFDMQVQVLKDLNTSRNAYLLLLTEVSKLVVPGVRYSAVTIGTDDEAGAYVLSVRATADSLIHYHQQIQSVESAEGILAGGVFEGYTLDQSEGRSTTAVLFSVSFKVPASIIAELLANVT